MRSKKFIIPGFITVLGVLIFLYSRPVIINKQFEAVIYSFEDDFEQQDVITLEGELHRDPFAGDVLLGEITVGKDIKYKIKLKDNGAYYFYPIVEISGGYTNTIGTVYASKDLENIWIKLKVVDERLGIVDGYIFGPAQSKEEANELIKKNILKP